MIFSSHVLSHLPLNQCYATCLSGYPVHQALFSAILIFWKLQIYNLLQNISTWKSCHHFISACLNWNWASPLPFGSYFLTSWILLLAAASSCPMRLVPKQYHKRLFSLVSHSWRGTRSWFCNLSIPFTFKLLQEPPVSLWHPLSSFIGAYVFVRLIFLQSALYCFQEKSKCTLTKTSASMFLILQKASTWILFFKHRAVFLCFSISQPFFPEYPVFRRRQQFFPKLIYTFNRAAIEMQMDLFV